MAVLITTIIIIVITITIIIIIARRRITRPGQYVHRSIESPLHIILYIGTNNNNICISSSNDVQDLTLQQCYKTYNTSSVNQAPRRLLAITRYNNVLCTIASVLAYYVGIR